MPTNLCEHFHCPHYSETLRCQKYLVATRCPVNKIKRVYGNEYWLSIDLDKTSKSSRDLIRYGIAMTSMEVSGEDA